MILDIYLENGLGCEYSEINVRQSIHHTCRYQIIYIYYTFDCQLVFAHLKQRLLNM